MVTHNLIQCINFSGNFITDRVDRRNGHCTESKALEMSILTEHRGDIVAF